MSAHVAERLAAYLDGELAARERSEIETHLRGCEACARRLEEMTAVDAAVRDLPAEAPPGYFESFPARVRTRLEAGRRRVAWRLPLWYAAAAAALILAVVVPLTTIREHPAPAAAGKAASSPSPAVDTRAADALTAPAVPPAEKRTALGDRKVSMASTPPPKAVARPEPVSPPTTTPAESPQAEVAGGAAAEAVAPPAAEARRAPAELRAQATSSPPASDRFAATAAAPAAAERDEAGRERKTEEVAGLAVARGDQEAQEGHGKEEPFLELASRAARTTPEARALREAWRAYVRRHPTGAQADEARVRVIESGLAAYRLSRDSEDLARVREDASAYLRREDAAQAGRVRAVMKALEAERP